jgi:putative ABC transport system permease protein
MGGNFEIIKKVEDRDPDYVMLLVNSDSDFLRTFGIEVLNGSNFLSTDIDSENPKALLNERAVRDMELQDPLGMKVFPLDNGVELEVSGVIGEVDFSLSRSEATSVIIRPYRKGLASEIGYLTINMLTDNLQGAIEDLEQVWNKQGTGIPFQYHFFDQIFDQNYRSESRLSGLLNIFSGIAITIGLLGLVGLVSFSTEQMQKSIGIRKVFGASVSGILFLLTKDFLKLILTAFVIAIPVTNYFIKDWLKEFVHKIDIEVWLYAVPGIIILFVAMVTIWGQSYKAAKTNPIDTIKNE